MGIPFRQKVRVGLYLLGKKLTKKQKFPLVLMLEPLFQCNLACKGCGKIDYPSHVLRKRVSVENALQAVEDCKAPIVSIPGGEPLIHKDMPKLVKELVKRKKFVYLCTNALLLEKKIDDYSPSAYLTFSVHLDGFKEKHDKGVGREGIFNKAISAINLALKKGFRVNINCTLFANENPETVADFFDYVKKLGVEGITVSPGYLYEHAPEKDIFLSRNQSKQLFRNIFSEGKKRRSRWPINHSSLYLDFLCGNQSYQCTPWAVPTYNIFGWQKPCYLLVDEGIEETYNGLMTDTSWKNYGVGVNPKCDNCMAHCGFEGTAIVDTFKHPFKALKTSILGPRTKGPFVKDFEA